MVFIFKEWLILADILLLLQILFEEQITLFVTVVFFSKFIRDHHTTVCLAVGNLTRLLSCYEIVVPVGLLINNYKDFRVVLILPNVCDVFKVKTIDVVPAQSGDEEWSQSSGQYSVMKL